MSEPVAVTTIRRWRENPVAFALECCKFDPDPWQADFLRVFPSQEPDKLRIALQACTGPGKTAAEAIAALNFISCYGTPDEHPRGLITSIDGNNLKANVWPALSEWQQRSEYLKRAFLWTASRFSSIQYPSTWFLEARTWQKKANPDEQGRTFSGLHAPFVFVLIDESGDVPVPVLRSAEQIFSSRYRWAKVVQGGNPTSLNNSLHHAATTARHLWHVIRVTGDPDDPMRSPRIDMENAREMIRLYTRDNPWVKATILGEFPPASINALLGVEDVERAMARHYHPKDFEWSQKRIGIDVARFGDDRSVIAPRQGFQWVPPDVMRLSDTSQVAARAAKRIIEFGAEVIVVDDTGHWGHGVYDQLRAAGHNPIALQYHAPAIKPQYLNRRAEMWMQMAEEIKAVAAIPETLREIVAELTSAEYTYINGKFAIIPKEIIKKTLGRSPDIGDAYAQTYSLPEMPGAMVGVVRGQSRARVEFDPFRDE